MPWDGKPSSAATASSSRPSTALPESSLPQDLGTFCRWSCHCSFSFCSLLPSVQSEVISLVSWDDFLAPPTAHCLALPCYSQFSSAHLCDMAYLYLHDCPTSPGFSAGCNAPRGPSGAMTSPISGGVVYNNCLRCHCNSVSLMLFTAG